VAPAKTHQLHVFFALLVVVVFTFSFDPTETMRAGPAHLGVASHAAVVRGWVNRGRGASDSSNQVLDA